MNSDVNLAVGKMAPEVLDGELCLLQLHKSVMRDEEFDQLSNVLLKYWDQFEHRREYLVTREDLEAGTLYAVHADSYPTMVKCATEIWLSTIKA